ncbi:glycosyltransferase involved in cell wall biosynthesis [Pedobacter cryoconitis]|uniref:Glycosyltransferase involved in cell wall biosynthesis n=1 Tax=Pedobacter cryoconitis TaxID=188932 RepID=A0A7W8YS36_9SPHI|nr:glycosyltransferase [Pedobacter cryoconitis]MBB5620657.1 glycosyltransferase involved in cell wall biosynthesis [Pedobacter cryoconitis]
MKIKLSHPLISCICITQNRPALLLKAIVSFDTQNYPNRELVISYPREDLATKQLINDILEVADLRIVRIEREGNESLGTARNDAIANCNGDYICLWDDDDWYHTKRLAHQYNTMRVNGQFRDASIMTRVMLFDAKTQKGYLSFPYLWCGSLLCKKYHLLQHPFTDSSVAEDTLIVKYLESKKLLHYISDSAFLYLYVYHGSNALSYFHFSYYLKKSETLDQESTDWIRSLLDTKVEVLPS